jgi:hypothetical protein
MYERVVLCECAWIDGRTGLPTPDLNMPAGIALCKSKDAEGRVDYRGGFPICAQHAALYARPHISFPGSKYETITEWTVEPFAP